MYPLTPLLAGQASVFTPLQRGSPEGEDEVLSIDNLKMVLCFCLRRIRLRPELTLLYVLKLLFWTIDITLVLVKVMPILFSW